MTDLEIAGTAGAVVAGWLVQFGVTKEKFRKLTADVEELKAEHVKKSEHDDELLAIHKRIDRHSKESDDRARETQKLLSEIGRDMAEIKGFMRGRFGGQHETHQTPGG